MEARADLPAAPTARPVSVAFIGIDGVRHPDRTAREIARETIHIETTGKLFPDSTPPSVSVVVAWVAPEASPSVLVAIRRWVESSKPPIGLIGCARYGDTRLREEALAAGFDDFVTGEVSVRELAARIRVLARRIASPSRTSNIGPRFGRIVFDGGRYQVWIADRRVHLTRTQLAVMRALIVAKGRTLTRRQILEAAWTEDLEVGERAVDNVILRLRRKLGEPGAIVTVRGVGFRLAEG